MFEKFFNKPKQEKDKIQKSKGGKFEGKDLEGVKKESAPKPKLRFQMSGLRGSEEVGTDTLAREYIKKLLKKFIQTKSFMAKLILLKKKILVQSIQELEEAGGIEEFITALLMRGNPLRIV